MVNIELNRSGLRKYLLSQSVENEMRRRAQRIADASGEGYQAQSQQGKNRARASVSTLSDTAKRDNSARQTLLRNLRA